MNKLDILVSIGIGAGLGVAAIFGQLNANSTNDMPIVQRQEVAGGQAPIITTTSAAVTTCISISTNTIVKQPKKIKPTIKYIKTSVNMRAAASKDSKILLVVPFGKKVKCLYTKKHWSKVAYHGKTGFIYNDFLSKKKVKVITKNDTTLKGKRKSNADYLAQICISNYKKYNILPSICIASAITESGLGEHCNSNNLWGISTNGYGGFSSLEAGCLRYLQILNYSIYTSRGSHSKDYNKVAYAIQNGGYCCPAAGYAQKLINYIHMYDLDDYDKYVK